MKVYDKICSVCKGHDKLISSHSSEMLYVIDRAKSSDGDIEVHETEPDIKGVIISNPNHIDICFDRFPKNAFKIRTGIYRKQCEGALFPSIAETEEWMLFIETKYAPDLMHAQKPQANYIETATTQIKSVVQYFREKGIISSEKKVHAIVSFPLIDDTFDSWAFVGAKETIDEIRTQYGIIIRCTNRARIIHSKLLLLGL